MDTLIALVTTIIIISTSSGDSQMDQNSDNSTVNTEESYSNGIDGGPVTVKTSD